MKFEEWLNDLSNTIEVMPELRGAFEYCWNAASNTLAETQEELAVTDKLLAERNRLLEAIPECPVHGNQCVPHAVEWVNRVKTIAKIISGDEQ